MGSYATRPICNKYFFPSAHCFPVIDQFMFYKYFFPSFDFLIISVGLIIRKSTESNYFKGIWSYTNSISKLSWYDMYTFREVLGSQFFGPIFWTNFLDPKFLYPNFLDPNFLKQFIGPIFWTQIFWIQIFWTEFFGPKFFEPRNFWTWIFWPKFFDPNFWTWIFWTQIFWINLLDHFFGQITENVHEGLTYFFGYFKSRHIGTL